LAKRQAAITAIEKTVLDPDGMLTSFSPLPTWNTLTTLDGIEKYKVSLGQNAETPNVAKAFEHLEDQIKTFEGGLVGIGWQIDPEKLRSGLVQGLTANAGKYVGVGRLGEFSNFVDYLRIMSPMLDYRDYLRTLWTNVVSKIQVFQHTPGMSEAQVLEQMRNRFHQDFQTNDTTQKPVNEILIPIVLGILQAPQGMQHGFGVPPDRIPARGDMTPRAYLDALISVGGIEAAEMGLRYRTDFRRSDFITSDAVKENITTLQRFYSDSWQSDPDPVHTLPDKLNQNFIPDKLVGKAPLFLYYDEWLLQRDPKAGELLSDQPNFSYSTWRGHPEMACLARVSGIE
jgi:hypothetical protein